MSFVERRGFERVEYAPGERPILLMGDQSFEVVDCAERGLRYLPSHGSIPEVGADVRGTVRFPGGPEVEIEGVVVRVLWQNPHTLIAIDSVAGSERWIVESEGMTALRRLGWTKASLKNGDRIAVTGARAKDGRRLMRCKTISKDGRELPCFGASS